MAFSEVRWRPLVDLSGSFTAISSFLSHGLLLRAFLNFGMGFTISHANVVYESPVLIASFAKTRFRHV